MSHRLSHLFTVTTLLLSGCLATLWAADGQLLLQGLVTEPSCQVQASEHRYLAIPLAEPLPGAVHSPQLTTSQLNLIDCDSPRVVALYLEPVSSPPSGPQANAASLELVLLDQHHNPVHPALHPLQQEPVLSGSTNSRLNLVAQYTPAGQNGLTHLT